MELFCVRLFLRTRSIEGIKSGASRVTVRTYGRSVSRLLTSMRPIAGSRSSETAAAPIAALSLAVSNVRAAQSLPCRTLSARPCDSKSSPALLSPTILASRSVTITQPMPA